MVSCTSTACQVLWSCSDVFCSSQEHAAQRERGEIGCTRHIDPLVQHLSTTAELDGPWSDSGNSLVEVTWGAKTVS